MDTVGSSRRRRLSYLSNNFFSGRHVSAGGADQTQTQEQQYAYDSIRRASDGPVLPLTMSSVATSNTGSAGAVGRNLRKSSVLGASRKIVTATVRRPLRTVGRIVKRSGKHHDMESDEADLEGEEVEAILGEDGEGSLSSNELIQRNRFRESIRSLRSHVTDISHRRGESEESDPDWPVHTMEKFLRQVLMVLAAYVLGASHPEWSAAVSRAMGYLLTAWGTCFGILLLAFVQHRYPNLLLPSAASSSPEVSAPPMSRELEIGEEQEEVNETTHLLKHQIQEHPMGLISAVAAATAAADDLGDREPTNSTEDPSDELPHPSLTHFYVMDAFSGRRIIPNTGEKFRIENDWFDMSLIVFIRTPDVDDRTAASGSPSNQRASHYFRGRQRRFEFQFQTKVKKPPEGKAIYFACELDNPIKMGLMQRAFVGAAMAFVKTTNPTFHYSIQGSKPTSDGKWEKPCMSFTAQGSLDRLVATKPGEVPPELGAEIHEDSEAMKRRKKGVPFDWNTKDTYTMALWSAYADFLDWKVINLPGIRPFTLSSVLGSQCFNITLYLIDENKATEKHYQRDKEVILQFELSNERAATLGPVAMEWTKKQFEPKQKQQRRTASTSIVEMTGSELSRMSGNHGADGVGSIKADNKSATISDSPTNRDVNNSKSTDPFEETDEVDQDAATAAELGEGIYLQSGDSVVLSEFSLESSDDSTRKSVTNGGGFAVLQNQDVSVIIEKARHAKRNRLIKTGDTVLFKMFQKKGNETETRYLSIHRGWWLKWVTSAPTKNGYFTIYTHDSEVSQGDDAKTVTSVETQSAYLAVGGSFTLRHKRWSKFYVGVAAEPSPTYGGKMLGLYIPSSRKGGKVGVGKNGKAADDHYNSDDEGINDLVDDHGIIEEDSKEKAPWMNPLVLTAQDPTTIFTPNPVISVPNSLDTSNADNDDTAAEMTPYPEKLIFSSEHCQLDVPAWIEMMNRTDRVKHLAYVVRVTRRSGGSNSLDPRLDDSDAFETNGDDSDTLVFARIRTGRELAQIMRLGRANGAIWAKSSSSASSPSTHKAVKRGSADVTLEKQYNKHNIRPSGSHADDSFSPPKRDGTLSLSPRQEQASVADLPADFAFDNLDRDGSASEDDFVEDGGDEGDEDQAMDWMRSPGEEMSTPDEREPELQRNESKGAVRKGRAILGKVAKTAKTATVVTGKTAVKTVTGTGKLTAKAAIGTGKLTAKAAVGTGKLTGKVAVGAGKIAVRSSKKVALGTVNAGKAVAVTAGKAVIAPVTRKSKNPPKQEPRRKRHERGLQYVKVAKTMRRIERLESRSSHPSVLAGELCAPEQSCRTTSRVLSRMSTLPPTSPVWSKANEALSSQLSLENEQDRLFLRGDAVQMGVTPLAGDQSRGILHLESVVARCLWESHWREEWCGMYETAVSFYAPMSKSPSLEIAYFDIQNVRPLDAGHLSPLPGFPMLVLETAWLCHYVAFRDEESRDTFGENLEEAIAQLVKQVEESAAIQEIDIRKARFWQGFQSLSETSLSLGSGKWATISSTQKIGKKRTILNGRRMLFDLHSDMTNGYTFVEELTAAALSFSLESLEKNPDQFVDFLDSVSHLRLLPLEEMDTSGKDAFCLFVNLYHCLLQHAMLLSVNGPLDRRSVSHFMRTTCYEIGGDIFSLAEINCCIIRGKTSKPCNPKPPYIEAPRKSNSYRFYALDYSDARVNFVLNTGNLACPESVPVLRADVVEHQLNDAAAVYLKKQLNIDTSKRLVVLPKVCEVYKNDFGTDALACLKFCIGGLDEGTASTLRVMMMDESTLVIRYHHTAEQYHTCLKLREEVGIQMSSLLNALYEASD